tara:strand:- start:3496 stop:4146 length:651 start_codon:yes stop_codon:yes gene_type:complete
MWKHTFGPHEKWPDRVITPQQTHGKKIVEIISGNEDLTATDGVWTQHSDIHLGVLTADCAPICFWTPEKFGVIHVGWRGLVSGICEAMLDIFSQNFPENFSKLQANPKRLQNVSKTDFGDASSNLKIFGGPLYPTFQIKKDFCFEKISEKFGASFFEFEKNGKIFFRFQDAIASVLPGVVFDPRSTNKTKYLASWRRNATADRNLTVVGHHEILIV